MGNEPFMDDSFWDMLPDFDENPTADIVCIGQAVVDCITRGKEEEEHRPNVFRADSITLSSGGDALNQAILLSQLGYEVDLVCGLGQDPAAEIVLADAKKWKVRTEKITQMKELSTPVANLLATKDGGRISVNSPATKLEGYRVDPSVVKDAKLVSLASMFRAPLDNPDVIRELVKAAKAEGAVVCADMKLPTFRQITLKDIEDILPMIDYIFPNETEAAYYTGETALYAQAQAIRDMGVKNVIIKAGKNGCYVSGEEMRFAMGAFPVELVDTTGAGDNFVAGFIHGLFQQWHLKTCCEYGSACAAISIGLPGATTEADNRKYVVKKMLGL